MKIKDTLIVVLSDMHTGGSTALFPRKGYRAKGLEGNLVSPNDRQIEIYKTFIRFAGETRIARKNRRMILVNLGDSIDGWHHGSMQESLFNVKDQSGAHVELMDEFIRLSGFDKRQGDELHYVKGTEVHVGEIENEIAAELGAVKSDNGTHINNTLKLNINGTKHLFAHHGKSRGVGFKEGNALRNYLADTRENRRKDGLERIDVLWSGHTHGHMWGTHIERMGGEFHEFHGIICPSWQAKTRYANEKLPMAVNSVGGTFLVVSVDGQIHKPHFTVEVTKDL